MLEMLQTNKTLTHLELAGNNIPSDVVKAIGEFISTSCNAISKRPPLVKTQLMTSEYLALTFVLEIL